MVDVKSKLCENENCNLHPSYNYEHLNTARYCESHMLENMVNVSSKKCAEPNCNKQPTYNVIGSKQPLYCLTHKTSEMVDIRSKKCFNDGCNTQPSYNFPDLPPLFCKKHKNFEMINVSCNKCNFLDCYTQPNYNFNGETKPLYCAVHKLENMIDINNPICRYDNCTTRAGFNYENLIKPIYCFVHKSDEMYDVVHKKCITPLCYTRANVNYDKYCFRCFIYTFPDSQITRNYKTKEQTVVDFILKSFPDLTWILDKRIYDGCHKNRPDLFVDFGDKVIVIEIDENQHRTYSCENRRIMEISQDLQHRPMVFIRFNPDSYIDNKNKKIKSCWKTNKKNILVIDNETDWQHRLKILKKYVKFWIDKPNKKTVKLVELFYDNKI
jgi:hypothetical protein